MPRFTQKRLQLYLSHNLSHKQIEERAKQLNTSKSEYICSLISKDIGEVNQEINTETIQKPIKTHENSSYKE